MHFGGVIFFPGPKQNKDSPPRDQSKIRMFSPVSSVVAECHEDWVHARNLYQSRHDVCVKYSVRECVVILSGKSGVYVTMVTTNWLTLYEDDIQQFCLIHS